MSRTREEIEREIEAMKAVDGLCILTGQSQTIVTYTLERLRAELASLPAEHAPQPDPYLEGIRNRKSPYSFGKNAEQSAPQPASADVREELARLIFVGRQPPSYWNMGYCGETADDEKIIAFAAATAILARFPTLAQPASDAGLEPPGCPTPGACSCPGGAEELAKRLADAKRPTPPAPSDYARGVEDAARVAFYFNGKQRADELGVVWSNSQHQAMRWARAEIAEDIRALTPSPPPVRDDDALDRIREIASDDANGRYGRLAREALSMLAANPTLPRDDAAVRDLAYKLIQFGRNEDYSTRKIIDALVSAGLLSASIGDTGAGDRL